MHKGEAKMLYMPKTKKIYLNTQVFDLSKAVFKKV